MERRSAKATQGAYDTFVIDNLFNHRLNWLRIASGLNKYMYVLAALLERRQIGFEKISDLSMLGARFGSLHQFNQSSMTSRVHKIFEKDTQLTHTQFTNSLQDVEIVINYRLVATFLKKLLPN